MKRINYWLSALVLALMPMVACAQDTNEIDLTPFTTLWDANKWAAVVIVLTIAGFMFCIRMIRRLFGR